MKRNILTGFLLLSNIALSISYYNSNKITWYQNTYGKYKTVYFRNIDLSPVRDKKVLEQLEKLEVPMIEGSRIDLSKHFNL